MPESIPPERKTPTGTPDQVAVNGFNQSFAYPVVNLSFRKLWNRNVSGNTPSSGDIMPAALSADFTRLHPQTVPGPDFTVTGVRFQHAAQHPETRLAAPSPARPVPPRRAPGRHRFAFVGEQGEDDLRVRDGAKHLALNLQLAPQHPEVVDLVVEDDRITPADTAWAGLPTSQGRGSRGAGGQGRRHLPANGPPPSGLRRCMRARAAANVGSGDSVKVAIRPHIAFLVQCLDEHR